MNELFGGLMELSVNENLDEFLNTMTKEDSIKIIELAIGYAQSNGLYNIEESHILYKCLTKIKE